MKRGNRLTMLMGGLLSVTAVVLLVLVSVFRVDKLTMIGQSTELIYQSDTSETMSFQFSYLSAQDQIQPIRQVRFVAKDFPVYLIEQDTHSFGPFVVITVQAIIAPMETEWPEEGALDLSDALLVFEDGTEQQISFGELSLVSKMKNKGPFEITEMTGKDDGSFTIRLDASKMLHFAGIRNSTLEDVLSVLDITINEKQIDEWKGLLVPEGEIVIKGKFKEEAVDPLHSMKLSPVITLEDEKGNQFDLQFSTERKQQKAFNVFNLLTTTRKGGR